MNASSPVPIRAALWTGDLSISAHFTAAGERTGVAAASCLSRARLLEQAPGAALILLDLAAANDDLPGLIAALRDVSPTVSIIAFGPHVHEARLTAAREAGCDRVISRGQFHAQLDALLLAAAGRQVE